MSTRGIQVMAECHQLLEPCIQYLMKASVKALTNPHLNTKKMPVKRRQMRGCQKLTLILFRNTTELAISSPRAHINAPPRYQVLLQVTNAAVVIVAVEYREGRGHMDKII